ncbi:oligosaccharide biosynthesis protein Alg14 like-domain-containing protein [Hypoxylon rubiginosum]|uniref:Oligosaccharide biosynthesis protein Alg14 like-domain-containing protein n=1 Tax=Hypoxylon rubiginosum TaxID=110542 RepID=A0ACB9YN43_9PEZI|nr:oligosaccharide biosynthesis protein Alg14 like-domain-containing protein [Hypoxylon rubiginosum]
MASQPHRSRVGQGVHSDGNKSKAFSSGTQLSGNNNNNPIPPRIGTVEEPPSPTVDDINLDPNTSTPFICEPQQSIAEMERDRERVLTTAFKERFIPTMFLLSRAMHYAWFRGPNATRSGIFAIIFCIALIFTWYSVLIVPVVFIAFRHCVLVLGRRRIQRSLLVHDDEYIRGALGVFLFICGSGGHTNEMLRMLMRSVQFEDIGHRRWAVGADDVLSFKKVLAFEHRVGNAFQRCGMNSGTFNIRPFNRARHVHQGWSSASVTVIKSMCDVLDILLGAPTRRQRSSLQFPNVIVSNGPGTGFLFLLTAHVLKLLCLVPEPYMKTVYVESWARVKTLSLSAKLVKFFQVADVFVAQHRQLASRDGQDLTSNMVVMPPQPHIVVPEA